MRTLILFTALLFLGMGTFGQKKMSGIGGEVSALSLKPTARWWVSKTSGFDIFAGVSAEFEDFKPNDYEAGAKYLRSFSFRRTDRTYFGVMGKYKGLKLEETTNTTHLPVFGVLVGKEWFSKRVHKKGFAVELGYQYGKKDYNVYNSTGLVVIGKKTYNEFPLLLNLRYAIYKD